MKTHLAAVALAAALTQPATATTFPSLTTIYVAGGVVDDGGADNVGVATVANCSNVSGVSTNIRVLVLNNLGGVAATHTFTSVLHGGSVRASTHITFLPGEQALNTGQLSIGVINVESLQSGVFCTFTVVNAAGPAAGWPLHGVRVNPHPGTVE